MPRDGCSAMHGVNPKSKKNHNQHNHTVQGNTITQYQTLSNISIFISFTDLL